MKEKRTMELDRIGNLLRAEYKRLDAMKQPAISTLQLATAVYAQLDPEQKAPPEVHALAIATLRQVARKIGDELSARNKMRVV